MKTLEIAHFTLSYVATVPGEIPKRHFQQYYSFDYLRYLTRKQSVIHLPTHLKMPSH